jgi:integrase
MPRSSAQHTLDHRECPACEEARRATMSFENLSRLFFPEAAAEWFRTRRGLSEASRRNYHEHIRNLTAFFGKMRLREIHIGNIVSYQEERQAEIRTSRRHRARLSPDAPPLESDGASRINHEVSCLGQVMAQAGLWEGIKRFYNPLPLPRSGAMALTHEEEQHLFAVARGRSRWFLAYCCGLISRNTTAGPGEIRHLRLQDLEIDGPTGSFIHIQQGVKNDFRRRPLPLNTDARWAILQLYDRARRLGACDPHHYLLPHRARRQGQPVELDKPMGSWKKAHYAMCREAAKQFPRLANLRPYDFRHTACTDLLEDPSVAFTTIEHLMGHRLSSHTKRTYDHLRNTALSAAAEALNRGHSSVVQMPTAPAPREQPYVGPERRRPQSQSGGLALVRSLRPTR